MQTLDKYQILEKIGVGGFGVVYKATDPFIKRLVAIKTCTTADAETRGRFLREAEIAGNLHHRNIVTVYDFGYQDETPFLVQEYLSGEDLDRKIRSDEFLPLPTKILYLVQIARGLDHAHSKGVIHRDIKPANIRILEDDTAKIMDFGIARLAQQQQSLTQAGITLGTAAYLAPEQIKGEPCDARTDIFSFGALAFELITGERPFGGADISAVFFRILNEDVPSPRSLAPDCSFDLEKIVLRCLEKDPAKRFPNSHELLRALEELAKRRGNFDTGTAIPLRRPPQPPAAEAPAVTMAVAGGTGGAAVQAPHGRASTRSMSLDDVVLDTHRPSASPAGSDELDTVAFRRARGGFGTALKIVAGLALLAAAGWGLLRAREQGIGFGLQTAEAPLSPAAQPPTGRQDEAPARTEAPVPPVPTDAAAGITASAAGDPPAGAAPVTGADASPPEGGAAEPSAAPAGSAAEMVPSTGGTTDAAASPAVDTPPAAPPPPEPAILVVAPGWDSSMTVRVGRKNWTLDRERRFELEPGSYKLRFAIRSPSYTHEAESTVRLESGATRRISPPLDRPGRLTVQPHLNTRQGYLRLDGTVAGSTPLRGRWMPPGMHRIEIAASADPGAPALVAETVEIASDRETLLTFDLDGKLERRVSTRPALPN